MSSSLGDVVIFDAAAVRRRLTIIDAIPLMRDAMIALSSGQVEQMLRSFIRLGERQAFAIMPAAIRGGGFGAKLVGVYAQAGEAKTHEGLVVLFDAKSGAPVCLADGGEVTAIRTPAASAAATDTLARADAEILAVLGAGRQARGHVAAIAAVRPIRQVRVWGRDRDRTRAFAESLTAETGIEAFAAGEPEDAVRGASIVCTTTASVDPVLKGEWVEPGAHVNLVGSSGPASAEADVDLVLRGRLFADHRPHMLAHGGEFLRAKAAGAVDETAIVAEIGAVFAGEALGRTDAEQITIYKSLGHAVQDLAVAMWLLRRTNADH